MTNAMHTLTTAHWKRWGTRLCHELQSQHMKHIITAHMYSTCSKYVHTYVTYTQYKLSYHSLHQYTTTAYSVSVFHTNIHHIVQFRTYIHHIVQFRTYIHHIVQFRTYIHHIVQFRTYIHHIVQFRTYIHHIVQFRTYIHHPTIMQGISVCLFANSSFSLHAIDVKLAIPPQRHPWSVLRGLAFRFRSYFENSNGTVLSAVLERRHFNDTF